MVSDSAARMGQNRTRSALLNEPRGGQSDSMSSTDPGRSGGGGSYAGNNRAGGGRDMDREYRGAAVVDRMGREDRDLGGRDFMGGAKPKHGPERADRPPAAGFAGAFNFYLVSLVSIGSISKLFR